MSKKRHSYFFRNINKVNLRFNFSKSLLFATIILATITNGLFFTKSTNAQTYNVNSPYSRLGIGEMNSPAFAFNRAMGGITAGFRSPTNLNYSNPASYSALRLTTLETAVTANGLWLNDGNSTERFGSGSLSYLAFGFPIANFWGLSGGLIPYSSVSYDVQQSQSSTDIGDVAYRFTGEGQLYQFYIGNGFRYKRLSAGFNVAYLFGTLTRTTIADFPEVINAVPSRRRESLVAKDFIWNAGLQYAQKLKGKTFLTLGLSGNTNIDTNFERDILWERVAISSTQLVSPIDTVSASPAESGNVTLPAQFRLGAYLNKGAEWSVGLDVSLEQWSKFQAFEEENINLVDATKVALGVAFRPSKRERGSFWQSANYKFGGYYNTNRFEIDGESLPEFGLSTGMGIPLRKLNSKINIALEAGSRGKVSGRLFRETFFNATVGFTLNDRWFVKRKFD